MGVNRIGFISPKSSFYFRNEEKSNILLKLPGFNLHGNYWGGLGTALPILASLTDDSFEIEIIDENVEKIDFERDYKIVAVTAMTHQAIRAYQICSEFRKKGVYTVIGGLHPTFLPKEASIYADTVVIGEAENIWPSLIKDLKKGSIKQFYYFKDFPSVDLTSLPIPRYDLLKNKNYNIIWIDSRRGCPYDCEFCSVTNLFGKKHHNKSIEQICNEVEFIKKEFNRIFIGFSDDNLFINKKFSKKLMHCFKELNFRWVGQSDISIGDDLELLPLIFKAGCHVLFIGFESLSQENLENIYKNGRKLKKDYLSRYEEMTHNIQSHGIGILGSFIIGLDHDNKNTLDHIVNFIDKTNMLTATINVLTPLPGTRLRERLLAENRILSTSWDNYTFWDVNFIPKNLSKEDIETGMIEAFKRIYSEERMRKTSNYFKEIFKIII